MSDETAKILRAPFPAEKVGKLPRVSCGDCRESRARVCDKHTKQKCVECNNWITTQHLHLDYVGHADVTDRLLEADPGWTWEPFALDAQGLPAIDANGGMWIRLTVAGVTRIGYGDADGKRGGSAVKETIGDALRNASMRFGVALDLWRKEGVVEESSAPRQQRRTEKPAEQTVEADSAEQQLLADAFEDEIAKVRAASELKIVAANLLAAKRKGEISKAQYDRLAIAGGRRKKELDDAVAAAS